MKVKLVLTTCILLNHFALSKVGDPPPVKEASIEYRSHANQVTAIDRKTTKVLWQVTLYPSIYPVNENKELESDVQWDIISGMKVSGDHLHVKTSKGNDYILDAKTGKIRSTFLNFTLL